MNKLIDLHMHTNYSDGDLTPDELAQLVKESNIRTFSITDHDTVLGVKKLYENIPTGIDFVPGIELSAYSQEGRLHILGYGIDVYAKELNKKLESINRMAIDRIDNMYQYIKTNHHIIIPYHNLEQLYNSNKNIGRPELAKLLLKYNYVTSFQEAFDKYLIEAHNNTNSKSNQLEPKEAIELIIKSGGIAVIAHPISLKKDEQELEIFIREMINYGLRGLEVYHSDQSLEYRERLMILVNKYKLLYSGGSDFHGKSVKPDVLVGSGRNNVKIRKLSLINELNR